MTCDIDYILSCMMCTIHTGATVALGLTFLKTGNKNIARTLAAPGTEFLLEGVRPDLLLLRTVCYGWALVKAP